MFSSLRRRITTPAGLIAVLVLVLALTGAAFAASGALTAKQKKEVKKIAKSFQGTGPAGPAGAAGAAGSQGPKGAAGSQGERGEEGPQGSQGKAGTNGTNGINGTSVVSSPESPGANCENGGSKFVAGASTTYACNGKDGQTGFTETLPTGKSETGTWQLGPAANETVTDDLSFPIPLATGTDIGKAQFVSKEQVAEQTVPTGCSATLTAGALSEPKAAPGNLCVFEANRFGNSVPQNVGILDPIRGFFSASGPTGALLIGSAEGEEELYVFGTWVVTAE